MIVEMANRQQLGQPLDAAVVIEMPVGNDQMVDPFQTGVRGDVMNDVEEDMVVLAEPGAVPRQCPCPAGVSSPEIRRSLGMSD